MHAADGRHAPLVSIVIPCYNQAAFLAEAIDSAHRQRWHRVDVVVVDDGSTDGSAAVAAAYPPARLLRYPNRGVGHARNAGLEASRGEILIFLDADDRLEPDAAAIAVRMFDAHPGAAMVAGRATAIDAAGRPRRAMVVPLDGDPYMALLRRNHIWSPAMAAWRRDALVRLGGFRTDCDPAADYDLYLRAARQYEIVVHEHVVAAYRQHGANMSSRPHVMLTSTLRVLEAERRHVRGHPERERAFREGMRTWRAFYGEQMVEQFRVAIRRRGGWREAARWALRLLRLYPRGVARHLWRKARRSGRAGG